MQPTIVTWVLVVFGAITLAPLVFTQLVMLVRPNSQQAKDILVATGEDWRDKTHFQSALGFAWADWLLVVPMVISGSIGAMGATIRIDSLLMGALERSVDIGKLRR